MPLRPESVGDGGADEPEEHEQLSAGTAGRGRDVDGLSATRAWARALGWRSMGSNARDGYIRSGTMCVVYVCR